MIRAGLLTLALAGPAAAEGQSLCAAAWAKIGEGLAVLGPLSGAVGQEGDWCVVEGLVLDLEEQYLPDWQRAFAPARIVLTGPVAL